MQNILAQDEVVARELERLQRDNPTEVGLSAVDHSLDDVSRKQMRVIDSPAEMDGEAADVMKLKPSALSARKRQLQQQRQALLTRRASWQHASVTLDQFARWRLQVEARLGTLTYQERRLGVESLRIGVRLFRADHVPRYDITAASSLMGEPFATDEPRIVSEAVTVEK